MNPPAASRLKSASLGLLLVAVSIAGPVVAYAGVSVVWPLSQHTIDVNTSPPIKFLVGADYGQARALGYLSPVNFEGHNSNASFTITIKGLSGGKVTIDNYTMLQKTTAVSSYRVEMANVVSDTLAPAPTIIRLRFWSGTDAPDTDTENDADTTTYDVLNLTGAAQITSSGADPSPDDPLNVANINVQVIVEYGADTTGTKVLNIRPNTIVYA